MFIILSKSDCTRGKRNTGPIPQDLFTSSFYVMFMFLFLCFMFYVLFCEISILNELNEKLYLEREFLFSGFDVVILFVLFWLILFCFSG